VLSPRASNVLKRSSSVCINSPRSSVRSAESCHSDLFIASAASFIVSVLTLSLPVTSVRLLRRAPLLWFLLPALRSWRLLLPLLALLYSSRLLSLFLWSRAALLRRGVLRGRSLHVFATPLRWL